MPVAGNLYYHQSPAVTSETPPVVLIHGAGGMHLSWAPGLRRLPGYRVCSLDLPGHGKSSQKGGQQSIRAYADSVLEWLQAMQLTRAVFVGHCMGGAVALQLGIDYAEHVAGLGLVATGARLRVHPDLLSQASNPTTFYKAVDLIMSWSFDPTTSPRLIEPVSRRMAETRPSVLLGDLQACNEFDCIDRLASIRCPTLVVCGDKDQMTPRRYAQFLADSIQGASLVIIPQAGHMLPLEQPVLVAEALRSFLRDIPYLAGRVDHVSGN